MADPTIQAAFERLTLKQSISIFSEAGVYISYKDKRSRASTLRRWNETTKMECDKLLVFAE